MEMGVKNILILLFIGYTAWKIYDLNRNPPLPVLEENPWWGPGKPGKDDTAIKPFKIKIPQEEIQHLKKLLSLPLRLTPPLEDAKFTYGFSSDVLKIEGLHIHFLHIKPSVDPKAKNLTVLPLLMIHGWPGSFVEFDQILPLLTSPHEGSNVVFEVICPSIPGYAFSQAASKQGLGTLPTSQIFLKLMKRLGFEKFYVQGGDWGSLIASTMATLYPQNIIAMHTNMPGTNTPGNTIKHILGSFLPSGFVVKPDKEYTLYPLSSFYSFLVRESGYMHLQSTKPDTIGAALENSPVGLAAYILEKFSTWTNRENVDKDDGGLLSNDFPISLDRLLDNLSIYWFSRSITSSMRYYAESFVAMHNSKINSITCDVPSGFSAFKNEIIVFPENMLAFKFKAITFYRFHEFGGHFAAFEVPAVLAKDIHDFVTLNQHQIGIRSRGEL
ncbi:Juvenile hormone epoxide hydrolase 1 [Armadillidium nasatum]|uniref:Epoxide hydrolase n=1 Tax=Armadillidium nasatum TaxID=96803 RepID=A0A5N5TFX5_9CRUS|nr:Juvenile hormone epoxide hydrolase 1 [Armadillidium nasatum]